MLDRWSGGDPDAFSALVPFVYSELKALAESHLRRERDGHTLQPTALVHEAFLRLRGAQSIRMHNRAYFFGAAAQVMRRVLVDHARRRNADKIRTWTSEVSIPNAISRLRSESLAGSSVIDRNNARTPRTRSSCSRR